MQTYAPLFGVESEKTVNRVAVALLALLFAGALCADSIFYYRGSGAERKVDPLNDVTVTGWNAKSVEYRNAEGGTGSVPTADVVSLHRTQPGMSRELARAIELAGNDPEAGKAELTKLTTTGSAIDREEAAYWRARTSAGQAVANGAALERAIGDLQAYLTAYRAGYFSREVYAMLAEHQLRANKTADARATYGRMIAADPTLASRGNQLLGELEAANSRWDEALAAFKTGKQAASRDRNKNAEYLAQAWEGWVTLKKGDDAAGRTLLEAIVNDEAYDDPLTDEDDVIYSVAYPALADAYFKASSFERAYDAYLKGAYYVWWTQGTREGYCLGQAFLCARELESSDPKWRERRNKLRTALAMGFPKELQRVEKE